MTATVCCDWDATGSMLSGIGSSITALVAVVAAGFAWNQIQEGRRLNAEDAYLDFHRMCFDNPEFAEPDFAKIKKSKATLTKYHWFVIGMLICIERIITILPKDKEWRSAVTDDLKTHCDYVCSDHFAPSIPNFSVKMQSFLNEFVAAETAGAAHA